MCASAGGSGSSASSASNVQYVPSSGCPQNTYVGTTAWRGDAWNAWNVYGTVTVSAWAWHLRCLAASRTRLACHRRAAAAAPTPDPWLLLRHPWLARALQVQNGGYNNLYVSSVKVTVKDRWGYYYTAYAKCPSNVVPWVNAPGAYGTLQCNWSLGTWCVSSRGARLPSPHTPHDLCTSRCSAVWASWAPGLVFPHPVVPWQPRRSSRFASSSSNLS